MSWSNCDDGFTFKRLMGTIFFIQRSCVDFILVFLVVEGKRIEIPQKAGRHWPTNETPLKW